MTEHSLFDEVKEDLERQRLEALWKQYGLWVAVAALLVVVATGAVTAYRSWKTDRDLHMTAELMEAAKPKADVAKTIESLQAFADHYTGQGHNDLALLRAGALADDQNDKAKAVLLFDEVAADKKGDAALRQLADLLSVENQMDSGDSAALSARLQPLTVENAPWRYSALEMQAYLALRSGDKAKAKQIFTDLSQDARVPQTMAARAADLARSLN